MPRTVDHAARRREIVEAAWRVVLREGYAGLSVRSVATEGGWSTGSMRHYFGSQQELVAATTRAVFEQAQARVVRRAESVRRVEDLAGLVEEVLPLDPTRRLEVGVWLALVMASRTDEALLPLTRAAHRDLRAFMESVVRGVEHLAGVRLDVPLETDRLHALVDGMALHAAVHPRDLPATRMRTALRAHLDSLAGH
jgi:AcrR family transcriptional regulator